MKKDKISYSDKQGKRLYRVAAGCHVNDKGERKPTMFYLGMDESQARVRREFVRAEWAKLKAAGHEVWPVDILKRMAEQEIISKVTAERIKRDGTSNVLNAILKDDDLTAADMDARARELEVFRTDGRLISNEHLLPYLMTVLKQELTTEAAEAKIRKAIMFLLKEQPIDAVKLAFQLKQLCDQQKAPSAVTLNFGSVIAMDASEKALEIDQLVKQGEPVIAESNSDS